jgi:hypothetical protein
MQDFLFCCLTLQSQPTEDRQRATSIAVVAQCLRVNARDSVPHSNYHYHYLCQSSAKRHVDRSSKTIPFHLGARTTRQPDEGARQSLLGDSFGRSLRFRLACEFCSIANGTLFIVINWFAFGESPRFPGSIRFEPFFDDLFF